ncbi:TetR/AcrR family transcriptional regulator [Cellulomonas sp. McL0617]|uniref:TetR/AcrR family transcriptional regulator n=1 Tax=Cellulomonas sp. McL0617 TaxID=3415675 RepID=UPI003CF92AA7
MARSNPQRRRELADAVVALLAADGLRGVTHRAVDARAQVPTGTASNYFPDHDALLVAAAHRIVDLQLDDMVAGSTHTPDGVDPIDHLTALLAGSLVAATSSHRDRYRAIFELQLESRRRPAVAGALEGLAATAATFTGALHRDLDLPVPEQAVGRLMTLSGGVLFVLVTGPPVAVEEIRSLARGIVHGALGAEPRPGDD